MPQLINQQETPVILFTGMFYRFVIPLVETHPTIFMSLQTVGRLLVLTVNCKTKFQPCKADIFFRTVSMQEVPPTARSCPTSQILFAMATDGSLTSSGIAPSQFSELMPAINGLRSDIATAIDQKMAQLKRELVEEHGEPNKRLAKKLHIDSRTQHLIRRGTRNSSSSAWRTKSKKLSWR